MGELVYRRREGAGADGANPLIYVKAGSAIGGALLIDGSPVEGADGLAGDIAVKTLGKESLTASDIIDYLPHAFKHLDD